MINVPNTSTSGKVDVNPEETNTTSTLGERDQPIPHGGHTADLDAEQTSVAEQEPVVAPTTLNEPTESSDQLGREDAITWAKKQKSWAEVLKDNASGNVPVMTYRQYMDQYYAAYLERIEATRKEAGKETAFEISQKNQV